MSSILFSQDSGRDEKVLSSIEIELKHLKYFLHVKSDKIVTKISKCKLFAAMKRTTLLGRKWHLFLLVIMMKRFDIPGDYED